MLLQRKGLLSWLAVFRWHPGFQRPREPQRTVAECPTPAPEAMFVPTGSAKGYNLC